MFYKNKGTQRIWHKMFIFLFIPFFVLKYKTDEESNLCLFTCLLCPMSRRFQTNSQSPLQVLQGGGLESPTKPKGRPKKNSIPSSEQLEQDRPTAEEGSSSHCHPQEDWPGPRGLQLDCQNQNLWDFPGLWEDFMELRCCGIRAAAAQLVVLLRKKEPLQ